MHAYLRLLLTPTLSDLTNKSKQFLKRIFYPHIHFCYYFWIQNVWNKFHLSLNNFIFSRRVFINQATLRVTLYLIKKLSQIKIIWKKIACMISENTTLIRLGIKKSRRENVNRESLKYFCFKSFKSHLIYFQ